MTIGAREVTYLWHCLSSRGISVLPDSGIHPGISSAYQFQNPETIYWDGGILCSFCASFYKRAAPLHALKKKGAKLLWTEEHQTAFESLKQVLCEAPVLQVPDFDKEFVLVTDASDYAISAMLNQRVGQDLAPISYYSRLLSAAERNYSTYEKECLAVLFGRNK
jgi:hypothetical protein